MEKGFEMFLESWDESSMYEGVVIPVGFDQREYEEFYDGEIQPGNELVIYLKDGGVFYFYHK